MLVFPQMSAVVFQYFNSITHVTPTSFCGLFFIPPFPPLPILILLLDFFFLFSFFSPELCATDGSIVILEMLTSTSVLPF